MQSIKKSLTTRERAERAGFQLIAPEPDDPTIVARRQRDLSFRVRRLPPDAIDAVEELLERFGA